LSKSHYYSQHATALRAELGRAISREQMREFHTKQPSRHFLVAVRQFLMLGVATWALIRFENPLIWVPVAVVQGFTVFNFTVLLHEVLHHNVFQKR
jgi:fatty acid desaturase